MRANEFITEDTSRLKTAISNQVKNQINKEVVNVRQNLLPLGFFNIYDIMQAAASADGVTPPNVTQHYWNHNAAAPYTSIERKMLRDAYTAVGVPWDTSILDLSDVVGPQTDGAQSPVVGFNGYPR